MLAGTRSLDRRVQRQKIGLPGDLLHDGDLLGDGLHRADGAAHGLAAGLGVGCRLARYLLGLACIVGILLDVGRHLLHGGGSLLGRRRLLRGARRQLLGAGRHFLAARGDVGGGVQRIAHHAPKLLDHAVKRGNKILDFVVALDFTLLVQIASGDGVSEGHRAIKPAADAERHPKGSGDANHDGDGNGGDQHLARIVVNAFGFCLGLIQILSKICAHPRDLYADPVPDLLAFAHRKLGGLCHGVFGSQGDDLFVGGQPLVEALEELLRQRTVLRIGQAPEGVVKLGDRRDTRFKLLVDLSRLGVRGDDHHVALVHMKIFKLLHQLERGGAGALDLRYRLLRGEAFVELAKQARQFIRMPLRFGESPCLGVSVVAA